MRVEASALPIGFTSIIWKYTNVCISHNFKRVLDPHHVLVTTLVPMPIWSTIAVSFQLQVSRTKLNLRGKGCNVPNLIFILITLYHVNYKVSKLGAAFQFSILYIFVYI